MHGLDRYPGSALPRRAGSSGPPALKPGRPGRYGKFMAEIEILEENSLPRFYVDILGPMDGSDDIETGSPGGQDEKVT